MITPTRVKSAYEKTHHVGSVENLPLAAAFVALVQGVIRTTEQWSDMNGGRPFEDTTNYVKVIWFEDQDALNDWVLQNHTREKYKIFHMSPVQVELHTTVSIKE